MDNRRSEAEEENKIRDQIRRIDDALGNKKLDKANDPTFASYAEDDED